MRFWKYDGLDESFTRRFACLAEIEKIVAGARRLQAEGKLDGRLGDGRYLKQLAAQGDGLLERAASATTMYEELKRVAGSERNQRASAN